MAFNTDSDSYSLSIEHSDESHEGSKQANNPKKKLQFDYYFCLWFCFLMAYTGFLSF